MTASDIHTQRLRLVAITPEMLHAEAAGSHTALATLLHADVPAAWPPEHWEPHVFTFLEKQFHDAPHTAPWNRYLVLTSPPTLIGNMGGFPRSSGEAEIGYSILPSWQRLGLATEGLLALLEALFRDGTLSRITAQTLPTLIPSIRVLEKCGFQPDGEGDEPGSIRYRLERPR